MSGPSHEPAPAKLAAARVRVGERAPYFAPVLWRARLAVVHPWPAEARGEIAVTPAGAIIASRALCERASVEALAGAILHEVAHLVRDHAGRRGCREPGPWNLAADAAINPEVLGIFPLPYEGVMPGAAPFEGIAPGLAAEEYHAHLAPPPPPPPAPEDGDEDEDAGDEPGEPEDAGESGDEGASDEPEGADGADGDAGEGEGEGAGDEPGDAEGADEAAGGDEPGAGGAGEPADGEGAGDEPGDAEGADAGEAPGAPTCGSGAGGEPHPAEQYAPDAGEPAADLDGARLEVACRIRERSATRGDVPAGWRRWAEDALRAPPVPWQRLLALQVRAVARAVGAADYTYRRPARRSLGTGVILPALRAPRLRVAIVADTSGSISDEMLAGVVSEVGDIARAAGATSVRLIACDAQVHSDLEITPGASRERIRDALKGGGGTRMAAGLEAAARPARGERADCAIVLTDGYTPWPDAPRGMRVIVRVPAGGPATPAWARRVEAS